MNNVLSDMESITDISAEGSIFVSYTLVRSATQDNSIEGSVRADKNLVWSEFWAIYYQYKATCQNTAEAKAKVFVTSKDTLPKPPYKVGDMWICPSYTNTVNIDGNPTPVTYIKETFVCVNERKSGETAFFDDWQVMYDETSSHLELLKDSIKLWVENNSGIAEKIKSGIDLLAEGVKIYHTKSDGTKEEVNLISVGEDGIKINASLVDIDVPEFTLKGKTIDLTGDDITIDSTYFKVSKTGWITSTGGTIGGFEIGTSKIQAFGDNGNKNITLSPDYIWVGNSSSTDRYVRIDADGKITAKDVDLSGKITATSGKIANMDIASTEVSYQQQAEDGGYFSFGYDGIKAGYMTAEGDGYTPVTTTTIGKDGTITAPNVEFNKDGSGHVAGGNIAWHADGSASFRGSGEFEGYVKATSGEFHGRVEAEGGSFNAVNGLYSFEIDFDNRAVTIDGPDRVDENMQPVSSAIKTNHISLLNYEVRNIENGVGTFSPYSLWTAYRNIDVADSKGFVKNTARVGAVSGFNLEQVSELKTGETTVSYNHYLRMDISGIVTTGSMTLVDPETNKNCIVINKDGIVIGDPNGKRVQITPNGVYKFNESNILDGKL